MRSKILFFFPFEFFLKRRLTDLLEIRVKKMLTR